MLTGWMNCCQCHHHHLKAHHHRKRSLVVRHSRRQCTHLQATVYLFAHLCQSAPIQLPHKYNNIFSLQEYCMSVSFTFAPTK